MASLLDELIKKIDKKYMMYMVPGYVAWLVHVQNEKWDWSDISYRYINGVRNAILLYRLVNRDYISYDTV